MKYFWNWFALLMIIAPVLLAEFRGCNISGTEFSPDDFSIRSFSYYQSPISQTIRGGRELETENDRCPSIVNDGYITPLKTNPKRWDLVSENWQTSTTLSGDFDARFLTFYLTDETENWNIENPEHARLLWPEIAFLARNRLYLFIPDILENVLSRDLDLDEFKQTLKRRLKLAYINAAKVAQASGDDLANRWFKKAAEGDFLKSELSKPADAKIKLQP